MTDTTTYRDLLDREVYTLAHHLGEGWQVLNTASYGTETAYLVVHTSGLRMRMHIGTWSDNTDRLLVMDQLPELPGDIRSDEIYTTDITQQEIGMAAGKLENPRRAAREITRRLLPAMESARARFQAAVDKVRITEHHRRAAADRLAEIPGLSAPRRNELHIIRTERAFHMAWDGPRRLAGDVPNGYKNTQPSVRVEVDAGESAESVKVSLTGFSAGAARAAIEAAIAATEAEATVRDTGSSVSPGDAFDRVHALREGRNASLTLAGMRLTTEQKAPAHTMFAPDSFSDQIGKEVPVQLPGATPATGRIVAVRVSDDGRSVETTIDVDADDDSPN